MRTAAAILMAVLLTACGSPLVITDVNAVNAVFCDQQTDGWCEGHEDLGQCKLDSLLYCVYVLRNFDIK